MGRMKDRLINRPPTIGDYCKQGVVSIQVRCQPPCRRIGSVAIDDLKLPHDTPLQQVTKLRTFRCIDCDRTNPRVSPILQTARTTPENRPDSGHWRWVVVMREADGREGYSSPIWSREHADRFAEQQKAEGQEVLRIEGPGQDSKEQPWP